MKKKKKKRIIDSIKTTSGSFSNISIASRILLANTVTTASAERRFSKMKIIKNYFEDNKCPATSF